MSKRQNINVIKRWKGKGNILLEYMRDVGEKLLKKYSNNKNFNSSINEFDCATNEEDKEKVAKGLKEINIFVKHYIEMNEIDENTEHRSKLFDIVNAIEYFLYEYSKKWASDFNWGKQSKIIKHFM